MSVYLDTDRHIPLQLARLETPLMTIKDPMVLNLLKTMTDNACVEPAQDSEARTKTIQQLKDDLLYRQVREIDSPNGREALALMFDQLIGSVITRSDMSLAQKTSIHESLLLTASPITDMYFNDREAVELPKLIAGMFGAIDRLGKAVASDRKLQPELPSWLIPAPPLPENKT